MHSDGRHGRFAWPDMPQNAKSISVLHSWPFVAERTPDADNVKVKSNERYALLTRTLVVIPPPKVIPIPMAIPILIPSVIITE